MSKRSWILLGINAPLAILNGVAYVYGSGSILNLSVFIVCTLASYLAICDLAEVRFR